MLVVVVVVRIGDEIQKFSQGRKNDEKSVGCARVKGLRLAPLASLAPWASSAGLGTGLSWLEPGNRLVPFESPVKFSRCTLTGLPPAKRASFPLKIPEPEAICWAVPPLISGQTPLLAVFFAALSPITTCLDVVLCRVHLITG